MKPHCFICSTVVFPNDPDADLKHHSYFLHAQVAALQKTPVQLTLIQNGCEFPSLGIPVIRNPIPKSVAYNYLLCDANCAGDYWIFLPEDSRITEEGWEPSASGMVTPVFRWRRIRNAASFEREFLTASRHKCVPPPI